MYTGITTDVARRWNEHCGIGKGRGAKFFRGRAPQQLCFVKTVFNRSDASQLEAKIKKMSRLKKLELIKAEFNQISEFVELNLTKGAYG